MDFRIESDLARSTAKLFTRADNNGESGPISNLDSGPFSAFMYKLAKSSESFFHFAITVKEIFEFPTEPLFLAPYA